MVQVTVLQVEKGKTQNVWVVKHSDQYPVVVGDITSCGVPCKAKVVPIGTTYTQTLYVPEE